MSDEEFKLVFDQVFNGIPDYAKNSINHYINQKIDVKVFVSDKCVDDAQNAQNIAAPAGVLVSSDRHWYFAFRPYILKAPIDILKTIIRHEIIHGFLISVELNPTEAAKKAVASYEEHIKKICEATQTPIPDNYEEDMICIINDDWSGDEMKAKEWVGLHMDKHESLS